MLLRDTPHLSKRHPEKIIMKQILLHVVVIASLVSGCATPPTPQNAQEFRTVVTQGAYGTFIESFVVNRPYKEVAAIVKAKTNECLNAKVDYKSCTNTTSSSTCKNYADTYVAKVVDGAGKTEVRVQFRRAGEGVGEIHLGGKPPADGSYIMVADIMPAGNSKTKIEMYRTTFFKAVPGAIRHWSNSTSQGCPTFKEF